MPESALTLNQSWLFSPVSDFGLSLRIAAFGDFVAHLVVCQLAVRKARDRPSDPSMSVNQKTLEIEEVLTNVEV
jgi:hypothetical protein